MPAQATAIGEFIERIRAASSQTPLCIRGSGSKDFYGNPAQGEILDTRAYAGVVSYEPTELVITARSGTPLQEIETLLAERGQALAFEPPHFGDAATLGGCVAAGLSGPRRAAVGALRDFVLGVKMLDGNANLLTFGGQVMKNVAGYDAARLLSGSLGTLGLLLEVSLKVLPRPVAEATLRLEAPQGKAIELMNYWAGQPLPITATSWHDDLLMLRLGGARAAVKAASQQLGGEAVAADAASKFWSDLREQRADPFAGDLPLWRLALPSVTPPLDLAGDQLIEWGGSLRWLKSGADDAEIRRAAAMSGGHATLFRATPEQRHKAGVFQALAPALLELHRQLKRRFDPQGIFNRGRMYREF